MSKKILIIGGTSGLGLELAKKYSQQDHTVYITGRKTPNITNVKYFKLDITQDINYLISQLDELLESIPQVDQLIYAAGFYQEGHIDKLSDEQILNMINVGLTAPSLLVRRLQNSSKNLSEIIFITSTSQFTPRELEPMYTAVKSGLGMLGRSLSLDSKINKVFVAAPGGMKTAFWDENWDTSEYLDPKWAAEQIIDLSQDSFNYRFAKILRSPPRVEIVETIEK